MEIDQSVTQHDERLNGHAQCAHLVPPPSLGLLSKTLTHSPITKWILPGRIRHKDKDDLILVGEDFVEIRHIEQGGHLTHVATKTDFDCRIRSAKILGDIVDEDDLAMDIKYEDLGQSTGSLLETARLPPQCLVLALENHQLVFMFACEDVTGHVNFDMTSSVPLPAFPSTPQKLGKHLAVDPKSRAIAVAADHDNVLLYSVEPMAAGAQWGLGYLPVSHERPLSRIRGVILAMEFLYPPENDPDQVILLLVVVRDGKTLLLRVDWVYQAGIQSAQYHNPLPISRGIPLPNLLIPIQSSAAFILTTGPDVCVYTNILTGHINNQRIILPECKPGLLGSSPLLPRWVAWARPRRNKGPDQTEDYLYLAREDGDVFYLVLTKKHPETGAKASHVNNFSCHIEAAFACYGERNENDFFAICGDMSDGAVHNIMPLPETYDRMGSDKVSILPNWTPTIDIIPSRLSKTLDGSVRSRDALFTPGGRQPYGRLTELRFGIQARSAARFAVYHSVVELWCLPVQERGGLLILQSGPNDSRIWLVVPHVFENTHDYEEYEVEEISEDVGLSLSSSTIIAAVVADDCVMQVTEDTILLSRGGHHGLLRKATPPGSRITAAAISEEHDIAVTAVREDGQSLITLVYITADDEHAYLQTVGTPVFSDKEIVSASIFTSSLGVFAVFGTADASLLFFALHHEKGLISILQHKTLGQDDMPNACEDIVVLSDALQNNTVQGSKLMLLCGLRDGSIHAIELLASEEEPFHVLTSQRFVLGYTSVKLKPDTTTISEHNMRPLGLSAYATCGSGFFKITWSGAGSREISISDIWITDTNEPELQQGAVTAFAMVPSSNCIGQHLPQSLIATSSDTVFISKAEAKSRVVPRSVPVRGTPNRAIYSQSYGCFITAATDISVHTSVIRRGEGRSLRPAVHFKSSGLKDWEFLHHLDPSSRIYCITECAYMDPNGQKYVFVALGTGPMDTASSAKGEIILLQPVIRDGVIDQVRTIKARAFEGAVHALAPYGEYGLVACTNLWTYVFEYQPSENRFRIAEVCRFKHSKPGVYVSTAPPLIHISTSEDSLVTLKYLADERKLMLVGADSGCRKTVFHLTIDVPSSTAATSGNAHPPATVNILTTRDRHVVGQLAPSPTARNMSNTVFTLFDGILSRSQTRLRFANIRPLWKAERVQGILEDRLIGTAVDGTVTGLAILEGGLANRLRWVQRLCERSMRICPLAPRHSVNVFGGDMYEDDRLMLPPPGFEAVGAEHRVVKPTDMHINGDVLQRLLDKGGAALLRQMLNEETERKDRLADWVRENIDSQLAVVDTLAEEVKQVLDRWW